MSSRDDFSEKTRRVVGARAGWQCSICKQQTVGPSDESNISVALIGVAAHIAAAAEGGRRYDASMSPEQRKHADNAIWLCANHATLIDRDEVTYTVSVLQEIKRNHLAACKAALNVSASTVMAGGLIAVGPHIVATANVDTIEALSWTFQLHHFVAGGQHELADLIDRGSQMPVEDRFVLSNELGDGRVLAGAPVLSRRDGRLLLRCPVRPREARIDARKLGSDLALHPETRDLYVDSKGNIARVSGAAAFPQKLMTLLSMQRGESAFSPTAGSRFFEFFEAFKDSGWLDAMLKLDVIRLAAIPYFDRLLKVSYLPLQCVDCIHNVTLHEIERLEQRIPVSIDLDARGIGRSKYRVDVYIPTPQQMIERRALLERFRANA